MDASNYRAVESLKTGEQVTIRAVRTDDKDGFMGAFDFLSEKTVYSRFFSPRKTFSDEVWP